MKRVLTVQSYNHFTKMKNQVDILLTPLRSTVFEMPKHVIFNMLLILLLLMLLLDIGLSKKPGRDNIIWPPLSFRKTEGIIGDVFMCTYVW